MLGKTAPGNVDTSAAFRDVGKVPDVPANLCFFLRVVQQGSERPLSTQHPVEAAEGRTAHNNGWNGVNGMVSMAGMEWYQPHGNHSSHFYEPSSPQPPPLPGSPTYRTSTRSYSWYACVYVCACVCVCVCT